MSRPAFPVFARRLRRSRAASLGLAATLAIASALPAIGAARAAAAPLPQKGAAKVNPDYARCVRNLSGAAVSDELAATSCAAVLRPALLGSCVRSVARDRAIAGEAAVYACRSVRRPDELATCVGRIRRLDGGADPDLVLNTCRRSLLPARFSRCVTGLVRELPETPESAMQICIDGRDRPRDLYPAYPFDPTAP